MRGSRRNPRGITAVVLGVGLVLALLIVGLTSGFGGPSLPEGDVAFVEDVPEGGDVTREDFDRSFEQAAAAQGIRRAPKEGTPQYDAVKEAALNDLILSRWVLGEAAERGIEVSDAAVEDRLEQIRKQQFGSQREFERFLRRQHFTEQDALERVRLQLLSERIQEQVLGAGSEVSDDEITNYYESNIQQFTTPESRDVRLILNPKREKVEQARELLAEDDSQKSWKRVAKRFSTDEGTSNNGGLRQAVMRGQNEQKLDEAIFGAAEGELVGPVETDSGFYVLQVTKINPETTQELNEQTREQIRQTLAAQREQRIASRFQTEFTTKWRSRTICVEDFVTDRCSNAEPPADACQGDDDGEEPPAPPGEESEQQKEREIACPAFVPGRRVVEPGTAGDFGAPTRPQGPVFPQPEAPPFNFGQGLPIGPGG